MKYTFLPCFFLFLFGSLQAGDANPFVHFEWSELPSIPPAGNGAVQPGLAGAFIGLHNGALIIAGGANFSNDALLEGGEKVYHRDIYVLEKEADGTYQWLEGRQFSLPRRAAYGLTIATGEGLVCLGGMDEEKLLGEAFMLKWDPNTKEISFSPLPPLPAPMANMAGGLIGNEAYVAGSLDADGSKHFWRLDLSAPEKGWQTLPVWGGPPRTHAFGAVQNDGEADCFYLMKGRFRGNNGISALLTDTWVYHPKTNSWEEINPGNEADKFPLAAGTAVAVGANHILLFGGDDGKTFNRLEKFAVDIEAAEDGSQRQQLLAKRNAILQNHPGFSKTIWAFHTITHTWAQMSTLPYESHVTTTALKWDNRIIIPSGEVAPGIRTPKILAAELSHKDSFGTLNYLVLFIYLGLLVALGFVFSKNQHSTDDFFKGGNRIPWWAAGLSIFGTQLSAITFMAIPAKTFATDWLYFFLMMTIIFVAPFIICSFLPFYRRFNLTTAYEYLELRFNLPTRLVGSVMYVSLQLGRLGIVLLLPSLALSVVTGIDVNTCILTMGLLSILYTVLGGIEAVIWTDVLQVIVLLGGALLSLVLLYFSLDGHEISTYVGQYDKMKVFDFELSFSNPTLWVVLIGGLATNIVQYGSDQTVIQRYLTTKDEKSAARGIMAGAWLTLPATLIFFTLGTLLFVYYKSNPELLNPALDKTDAIFPWYIVNSLPQGVSGLLIAAVFAASMSSLDSSMNSVATVVTTDYFRRLRPLSSESAYLKMARGITIAVGIIGTGLALLMASWGISSLWDQFNMIVGLFAGGLGGVFLLGIFSKKANGTGALIGLLASGILQYLIKEYTGIHLLMYAFTGMFMSILIGWLASMLAGGARKEKMQYTYSGLRKK
ncbi:MAG: sodium/solute symporter [Lewinellaceae bacterium]|nr:sodium/solute symporter [Lewinellaceae bacterium]